MYIIHKKTKVSTLNMLAQVMPQLSREVESTDIKALLCSFNMGKGELSRGFSVGDSLRSFVKNCT